MTLRRSADEHAQAALHALARRLAEAATSELEALRADIETRLAAIPPQIAEGVPGDILSELAESLSSATAAEVAEAVAEARRDAEQAAHDQLAEAQEQLAEVRAAAQARLDEERRDKRARLEAAQAALEAARAAHEQLTAAREAAEARLNEERRDKQARLEAAQAALEAARTAYERLTAARDAAEARLNEERRDKQVRLEAAQAAYEQLATARDAAEARLDEERRDTEARLEAARAAFEQLTTGREAAEAQLDRARRDAEARLEAAQAHAEQLTKEYDQLAADHEQLTADHEQLTTVHDRLTAAGDAARAQLEQERQDNALLRRTIEELGARQRAATAAGQEHLEAVRSELTTALDDATRSVAELSASVAAAEQAAEAAREDARRWSDRHDALAAHEQQLRDERDELRRSVEAAENRLEEEVGRAAALRDALEAARAEIRAAQGDMGRRDEELQLLRKQVETLQEAQADADEGVAALDRLRSAFEALAGVTDTRALLETYVEQLGQAFDRVVLFAVHRQRLEGWLASGLDANVSVANLVIPLVIESPIARAVVERGPVVIDHDADEHAAGLFGQQVGCTVALPLVGRDRIAAVAYLEIDRGRAVEARNLSLRTAEILTDEVVRKCTVKGPTDVTAASDAPASTATSPVAEPKAEKTDQPSAPEPPIQFPGSPRVAARVQLPEPVEVIADGQTAWLVDISDRGAQILCSRALRPNHQVRLLLPREGPALACASRVVWSRFEMTPGGGPARYRAGLQFSKVETASVDAFLSQRGTPREKRESSA
jgi:hypothetical protein